jgi:hypothetical protein
LSYVKDVEVRQYLAVLATKVAKVRFLASPSLSDRSSACNKSRTAERMFIKLDIAKFYKKIVWF